MVYGMWSFVGGVVGFIICGVGGGFLIGMVGKVEFGESIVEEGGKWDKKKEGSGIMGGFMFIIGIRGVRLIRRIVYMWMGKNLIKVYFGDINKERVMIFGGVLVGVGKGGTGLIDE